MRPRLSLSLYGANVNVPNGNCRCQLLGMHDATQEMERKEEEFLHKIADRHAVPKKEAVISPIPGYLSTLLQQLCLGVLVLMVMVLVALYRFRTTDAAEHIEQDLVYALWGCIAVVFVVNAVGWIAISWQSRIGIRCFAFLVALLCAAAGFAINQLLVLKFSQKRLQVALGRPKNDFSVDDLEEVVNGSPAPSLLHRFLLDGPTHFLRWLRAHCSSHVKHSAHNRTTLQRVDSLDFYTEFWRPQEHECADDTLTAFIQLETVALAIVASLLAVMLLQLVLHWLLTLLDEGDQEGGTSPFTQGKPSRKRKKAAKKGKIARQSHTPHGGWLASAFQLGLFAITVCGSITCAISVDLLQFCDLTRDSTLAKWILLGVVLSGLVSVLVGMLALCCRSRGIFVKWTLMLLLTSQLYALSNCIELQQQMLDPAASKSKHTILQSVYELMSDQTCAPITQWRAHTCAHSKTDHARNRTTITEEGFDSVCEEELASLMLATLDVGVLWLSWLTAVHLLLLLSLLLPDIGYYATSFAQCCCRRFAATPSPAPTLSQSDPIVDPKHWKQASLQFQDARDLYLSSVRAKDSSILEVEAAAFDSEWMAMTGRSTAGINKSTVVFQSEFDAIVRSLIIRRLTLRCKMDVSLSISKDGRLLFVKIFASDNLLMATLCDMDYTLEFTDGVDPGPLFWRDKTEVKSDLKVLDPRTIKQKLRLLAAKDVISRKEAEQFPNESLSRVSGRIQVLTRASRIANKSLKCHNAHLPYASYVPRTEFQYLYKKYPHRLDQPGNMRRSMVLRTIDCIRITRHLIESEMNVNQMLQGGLLTSFQCLHSASRFDFNSKPALRSSWILFWRPRHLPGEYEPETHWFLNQLGRLYPFRQPLRDVRDYFGESIAFYFAWLAFYTQLLVGPAIGVAMVLMYQRDDQELETLWSFYRTGEIGSTAKFFMSPVAFALGIGIIVWGFLFAKLWERKCIWYQLEWGTTRLDLELHDRASFWGESRRNPVTNEVETHFSGQKRLVRQCVSLLVMLGLGAMNLFLVITLILVQGYLTQWLSLRVAVLGSSGCLATLIQWNGDLISSISHRLSEFENFQNEKAFQESVVSKVFVLQLLNTYTGLWILAFADFAWLEHTLFGSLYQVYRDNVAGQMNVLVQLETLLLMIFVTRIISHILAVSHNFSLGVSLTSSNNNSQAPEAESASVEDECALEPYRGSYEDYTQIVVQFGLVVMFSSVFPLVPLLALVECALEIRLDALDLCLFFQRPAPDAAEGIGLWSTCIQMQLKLALVTIFGLEYFTAENHRDLTFVQRMSSFLISTLGCWLLAEILRFLLPSTSRHAEEVQARNEFLVERYMGGDDTQPSDDGLNSAGELNKKNWILDSLDDGYETEALRLDSSLEYYKERNELLRRLNVALRKHDDLRPADELIVPLDADPLPEGITTAIPPPSSEHDENAENNDGDDDEGEMIVGYFKPVRSGPSMQMSTGEHEQKTTEGKELHSLSHSQLPGASVEQSASGQLESGMPPPDSAAGENDEPVSIGIPVAKEVRESSSSVATSAAEAAAESARRPSKRASFFARLARREPHSSSSSRKGSSGASSEGLPPFTLSSPRRASKLSPDVFAALEFDEANVPHSLPEPRQAETQHESTSDPSPAQPQPRASMTQAALAATLTQPAQTDLSADIPRQYTTKELSGMDAITEAAQRSRFDFGLEEGTNRMPLVLDSSDYINSMLCFVLCGIVEHQYKPKVKPQPPPPTAAAKKPSSFMSRFRRPSMPKEPPVEAEQLFRATASHPRIELSGHEAVHEATLRNRFYFSGDEDDM
ncbi:hypothetical protein FI667_g17434, partial [Globisporangium splendens]